jgi:hypothetical protein
LYPPNLAQSDETHKERPNAGCLLLVDIVAKRFFASRRATLIQAARPLDSKVAHLEGAADFCNKIGT